MNQLLWHQTRTLRVFLRVSLRVLVLTILLFELHRLYDRSCSTVQRKTSFALSTPSSSPHHLAFLIANSFFLMISRSHEEFQCWLKSQKSQKSLNLCVRFVTSLSDHLIVENVNASNFSFVNIKLNITKNFKSLENTDLNHGKVFIYSCFSFVPL